MLTYKDIIFEKDCELDAYVSLEHHINKNIPLVHNYLNYDYDFYFRFLYHYLRTYSDVIIEHKCYEGPIVFEKFKKFMLAHEDSSFLRSIFQKRLQFGMLNRNHEKYAPYPTYWVDFYNTLHVSGDKKAYTFVVSTKNENFELGAYDSNITKIYLEEE